MSTDALSLLTSRDIFTTGRIISRKPYYIKDRQGKPRRIGYKLAILTPHTIEYQGESIPLYISALGKSDSWFIYRKLEKSKQQIGVSGIRAVSKLYTSRGREKKKGFWIILSKNPRPNLMIVK